MNYVTKVERKGKKVLAAEAEWEGQRIRVQLSERGGLLVQRRYLYKSRLYEHPYMPEIVYQQIMRQVRAILGKGDGRNS